MRTACSPLSRISFGRMLSFFDPLVNLHSLTIQFLILFCQQLCHAKLFVSHLGWKLSAAIMMKRLNLHVIRLIYTLCKHLHVSAQSTINFFVHVVFCMPQVHMCSKTPTNEPSHFYLLSRCGELKRFHYHKTCSIMHWDVRWFVPLHVSLSSHLSISSP